MASTSVVFDVIGRDRNASDTFNRVGRAADSSSSKLSKFGGVAKTAAKAGGLALAAGAVVAGKALFDMTKAAAEDEAAAAKLAQTLKNTAGATDSQVASVEKWITAQGKALGVTDDELRPALQRLAEATGSVSEAQKLASLAMDASAGTGKSLKTVSEALMKAQNGSVGALSRLGIETKNAAGETLTFEQATKKMAQTFKGQAERQANTLQGKIGRLKLVLSEMGEEIGAKLIPIVTKMADWFLAKGLPALERFGAFLREKLPPVFDKIKEVISQFTGDGSGKLSKFIEDVKRIFQDGVDIVTRLWELFGDNIVQYVKSTFKNLKTVLGGAFKVIKGIFKTVSAILRGDWKEAWKGIQLIVSGAKDIIVGLVRQLGNQLRFALKNIGVALKGIWSGIWDGIKNAAKGGASFVVDFIKGIPGKIRDRFASFKEVGKGLITALMNGIKNAAGFASDFASQIWEAVKSVINAGIDKLNNLLEFDFKVKGIGITVDAPDIGHLATGTRNWRGGSAIVGERGPELVTLPRGSRVDSAGRTAAMGGGVEVNFNGPVYGDPQAFARFVRKELLAHKRILQGDLGLA